PRLSWFISPKIVNGVTSAPAPLGGLLRLLARVVFRVAIGDLPRADIIELNHRLLVHGHEVRSAGRKRDEASRWHGSRLARIGLLAHPDAKGPRDHGEGPGL